MDIFKQKPGIVNVLTVVICKYNAWREQKREWRWQMFLVCGFFVLVFLFVSFLIFPDSPLNESAVRSRHKKPLTVSQIGAVSVISLLWQYSPVSPRTFPRLFWIYLFPVPKYVAYFAHSLCDEGFVKWAGQGRPAPVSHAQLGHVVGRRAVLALEKLLWKAWAGEETNQTELLRLRKSVARSTL